MSVVGKVGYKETAIGWIPEEWSVRKLNDMCSLITKGTTPTTLGFAYQSTGVNFIKVECVDSYGQIDLAKAAHIDDAANVALKRSQLKDGDILYSIAGAIGRSAIVKKHHLPANTNQALALIRLSENVNYEYVRLCLSSERQLSYIKTISVSSAQANISLKDVASFELPIPPLPEQEKIAVILSAVDDKLDVIARQIDATNTLKRGLMQTLFSQGVGTQDDNGQWHPHTDFKMTELGEIPCIWRAITLGESVESIVGGGTPSKDVPEYWDGDIPWASVKDFVETRLSNTVDCISAEAVKASATRIIPAGTLITPTRMALGKVAFFTCDVAINQDLKAIFPKSELYSQFLFYWFQTNSEVIEAAGTGSTVKGIRLEVLRDFGLALPPLSEQQKIASILDSVDAKRNVLVEKQTHYQTLKHGLMQKLLTGEWRVKVA